MIDFRSYASLESCVLVKWEVPNFDTAYISDYNTNLNFNGNIYTNIGNLLSISNTTSELTSSIGDVTIGLSGVPVGSISTILNQEIKGSTISIYRAFFNPTTHAPLSLGGGNTILKFKGVVTNYSISDTVDVDNQLAVSTITLTCNSMVEVLTNKTNGRRTNPADFPNDSSMSRVQALANSNFNFGAP
jgi:hypothetical protein